VSLVTRSREPRAGWRAFVRRPFASARHSVRGKLVGIVLLTTMLVLLVSGTAMLLHALSVYRTSWASDIASEAAVLASAAAPALAFDDREAAERQLSALRSRSAVLAAGLYTADNHLYAQYRLAGEARVPERSPSGPEGLRIAGERVELLHRIEYKGDYLGSLYLRARYDVWGRVRTYLGIFTITTALSLAVALFFSSIIQRFITVPIEEIGHVARKIVEDQDYSLRLHKNTDDEIGLVVQAINRMLNEVDERTQELERSNSALKEADRRKDEFLATLAHELRNPLAPIRHATKILEASAATESQRKWGRGVIARQVEHMALLLDDLLDVSRITRGRLGLKKDYVSLEKIISAAVETARPLIDAKHHLLRISLPEESLELNVDPLRMSQVVSNLLTNAAKYTDSGGTLEVIAQRESAGVSISVIDNGIGLNEAMIPRIFEMFSQVENALERSQGGLGIGLALVKGLVELHGGTVQVESSGIGRGSRFIVRLPNAAVVQHLLKQPLHDSEELGAGPRCKILVVDDNKDAAQSLSMLLSVAGHQVSTANSGQDALAIATSNPPEVCILDIGMPGMSGYELAAKIREQHWGHNILLIAATGWGQQDDKDRAHAAGFDHHLTKPVDSKQLDDLLAQFCGSKS
jgi:two-component system, sensor histidine kinase